MFTLKRREWCVLQRVLQRKLSPHEACSCYFYFGICHLQVREEAKEYSPKSPKMGQRSAPPTYFNSCSTAIICWLFLSLSCSPRLSWVLNWQPFLHELIVHCLLQGFLWPQCYTEKRSPGEGQRAVGTQCLCLTGVLVLRAAWCFTWILAHATETQLHECLVLTWILLPSVTVSLVLILPVTLLFILSSCL